MRRAVAAVATALVAALAATVVEGMEIPQGVADERPVVGVLTLPNFFPPWSATQRSYFPASYARWLEAGGVRVVPIPFTMPHDQVKDLFPSLNGVLFTGGGAWFLNHTTRDGQLTNYAATGKLLFDLVLEANESGNAVPLWATCLGFELLLFLASGQNTTVLTRTYDALDLPLALELEQPAASAPGSLFEAMPPSFLQTLTTTNSTYNDHTRGCSPVDFASNGNLTALLSVLSTNQDRHGRRFVSTVQGVGSLPIFGTQWHPEKPQFEWNPTQHIPHDPAAVAANGFMSVLFATHTRQSTAAFPSAAQAEAALIYQHTPTWTGNATEFTVCYFFA